MADARPIDDPDLWRNWFGHAAVLGRLESLPAGNSPSHVYRAHLSGPGAPATVVVKEARAPWPSSDPEGHRREARVYEALLRRTEHLAPLLLACDSSPAHVRLVLQDLQPAFSFRAHDHGWQESEMEIILGLLARLHGATEAAPDLRDPALMPAPDRRWQSGRLVAEAARLDAYARHAGEPWLFEPLVEAGLRRYAADPQGDGTCLLHSDPGPANFAFAEGDGDGRLIDWHLAAAGPPAFDVAALFFQPYSNHRHLEWQRVFAAYGRARERLGLDPWQAADPGEASARYSIVWCALSYLPALAAQATVHGLSGWWRHTAAATHDNLATLLEISG
jgi:hypothetical protein